MTQSITDLWRLAIESRLLTPEQCQQLAARFAQSKYAKDATPKIVAEWLLSQRVMSKYQAKVLLAGRSGPFHFGEYRVTDRIDKGPLAGTFRAVHVPTSHPVQLSFLSGAILQQPNWNAFANYALTLCGLRHANLLRYYEVVTVDAYRFFVTEELLGESLVDRLTKVATLPPLDALQIILQVSLAIDTLHQSRIAHGDIRPAKIWLDGNSAVRVLCETAEMPGPVFFGVASTPQSVEQADYAAPEFLQPGKVADALTDVYAMGCLFYRLLRGDVPFPGGDIPQKLQRHATQPIDALENFGVPPPVTELVTYMMAKNPAVRIQSPSIVAERLRALIGTQPLPKSAGTPSTASAYDQWLQSGRTRSSQPTQSTTTSPTNSVPVAMANSSPQEISSSPVTTSGSETRQELASPFPLKLKSESTGVPVGSATPSLAIGTNESAAPRRKKSPKSLFIGLGGGAIVLIGTIVAFSLSSESGTTKRGDGDTASTDQKTDGNSTRDAGTQIARNDKSIPAKSDGKLGAGKSNANGKTNDASVVADDGKSLWVSPTAGEPIDFGLLPAGSQFVVHFRPADLKSHPQGAAVLQTLGPAVDESLAAWQQGAGVKLDDLESLVVTLHDDSQSLRATFRARLATASSHDELLEKLQLASKEQRGKFTIGQARNWAFLIPDDDDGRVFVMGAKSEIDDIADRDGAPPPPHRWIERLRLASDAKRLFTVFFTPHSLQSECLRDGREWAPIGDVRRTRLASEWFFSEEVMGVMGSVHLSDSMYLELRVASDVKKDRFATANDLRSRLGGLPEAIESYLAELQPIPYWSALAFRFPSMIRYLHENSRVGVDGDQAMVNAYLPLVAAPNLFLCGSMAIASRSGGPIVANPGTKSAASPMKTFEDVLEHRMMISIPQQDLVNALADIERSVNEDAKGLPYPLTIKMMGNDLKVEGITQNQKVVDFKMEDKTLSEILTGLVRKANPDPSVKDASELGQKLIWTVGPDPQDKGKKIIFVTTRAAAERDAQPLPKPFQPK